MGQSPRSTDLGLGIHGPLDVGRRHGTFLLIDAASWWMERFASFNNGGGDNGSGGALSREKAGQR